MPEKEPITEITASPERLLRRKAGSVRASVSDYLDFSPGDLFFYLLSEAIVRRIEERFNTLPRFARNRRGGAIPRPDSPCPAPQSGS